MPVAGNRTLECTPQHTAQAGSTPGLTAPELCLAALAALEGSARAAGTATSGLASPMDGYASRGAGPYP